jgi:hypothetical protein
MVFRLPQVERANYESSTQKLSRNHTNNRIVKASTKRRVWMSNDGSLHIPSMCRAGIAELGWVIEAALKPH